MKNIVLFAVIGSLLGFINALFWLIVSLVGFDAISGILPKLQLVGNLFGFVCVLSILIFFVTLYKWQK